MIAMSTVITMVTVTTMHVQLNSSNNKVIQELYKQIESDPNYPMIPSSTHKNQKVDTEVVEDISRQWHSSKLVELLDILLLINTCITDDRQLSYRTIHNKPNKTQFQSISDFKSIIFFNYLTTVNYTF